MSFQTETIVERNAVAENWFYIRLGSESSLSSEDDTESVYSVQDRTTDVVRDTTDTESIADCSLSGYELEVNIEYEVDSNSDVDSSYRNSSSGAEDFVLAAAAAIVNNSVESFITDGEESDTSSIEETSFGRTDFRICVQCKSQNDNPCYRYCKKCFQDRKTFYPPRPRRNKKVKTSNKGPAQSVKLDTLRSCLSGMSQDSGIGSSQECPPLDLHQIVVPEHLSICSVNSVLTDSLNTPPVQNNPAIVDKDLELLNNRKRQFSESSLSECDINKPKRVKKSLHLGQKNQDNSLKKSDSFSSLKSVDSGLSGSSTSKDSLCISELNQNDTELCDNSTPKSSCAEQSGCSRSLQRGPDQLCMVCNETPRNGIFIHGSIAHMCCCYKCAVKTWKTIKRCPLCNRKVNNVVKLYT